MTTPIPLIVVLLLSYFCGGWVAGRMTRFDGIKQGLAVWLWAVVIAIVVTIIGAIAGSRFNLLADVNSFPRIPITEGDLTTGASSRSCSSPSRSMKQSSNTEYAAPA